MLAGISYFKLKLNICHQYSFDCGMGETTPKPSYGQSALQTQSKGCTEGPDAENWCISQNYFGQV